MAIPNPYFSYKKYWLQYRTNQGILPDGFPQPANAVVCQKHPRQLQGLYENLSFQEWRPIRGGVEKNKIHGNGTFTNSFVKVLAQI